MQNHRWRGAKITNQRKNPKTLSSHQKVAVTVFALADRGEVLKDVFGLKGVLEDTF